jgi:hypothetical protein
MKFDRKEIGSLAGASLVLGFVYSFNSLTYSEFNTTLLISGWFRAFLLSFIIFSIYLIATKKIAKLHGATASFKVWGIERFGLQRKAKISNLRLLGLRIKSFKAGIFLPLIVSLFSNISLATIGYTELKEVSSQRTGKTFSHITDFETARIHLAGPLVCLLLAIILSASASFSTLAYLAKIVAIFSFVPLSKLDGTKILFGSIPLYLFGLIFTILSLLLINIFPLIGTIVWSLLTAGIIVLIYLYRA